MRILLVCPEVPWPMDQGGRTRTFQLMVRGLASLGHEVDALFVQQDGQEEHREIFQGFIRQARYVGHQTRRWDPIVRLGVSVLAGVPYADLKFTPRAVRAAVKEMCATERYDVVIAEHQHVAEWVLSSTRTPVLVDMHNVYSEFYTRVGAGRVTSLKALHSRFQVRLTRSQEVRLGKAASMLMVSPEDASVMHRLVPNVRLFQVPNGVDTEYFKPGPGVVGTPGIGSDDHIVMTGSMDYFPNVEGVGWFVREVMPLVWETHPEARFSIVGRAPVPAVTALGRDPRIVVTGGVPDVRPYLESAAVAVVPLLSGGGSRLKALEAAAMGRAIVGTTVGLEGTPFTPGADAVFANTPRGFADAIADLLRQPSSRAAMGSQARAFVESRYSWPSCWNALGAALDALTADGATAEAR